jgi:hypothetical protein
VLFLISFSVTTVTFAGTDDIFSSCRVAVTTTSSMDVMDGSSFIGSDAQHNPARGKTHRQPKNSILFFTIFSFPQKVFFRVRGKKIPEPI